MRNAAMAAIDAGTKDKQGATVPFSSDTNNTKSARNPLPAIAAALKALSPHLPDVHATALAKEVLKDLLAKHYVASQDVKLPSYKKNGSRNGSNDGNGLACHWAVVPWKTGVGPEKEADDSGSLEDAAGPETAEGPNSVDGAGS